MVTPRSRQGKQNTSQVGRTVRDLRIEADLSQADLARKLGVTREAVSAIETGRANVSARRAYQISEAIGCHPARLLSSVPGLTEQAQMVALWRDLDPEARACLMYLMATLLGVRRPYQGPDRRRN